MNPSNPTLSEARARIIWGEQASSVRDFLVSKGIGPETAGSKISQFQAERNSVIRKTAIHKILLGGGLLVSTVLVFLYFTQNPGFVWTMRTAKAMSVDGLAGFYGFCKLINGIIYLLRPQCEEESVTEISD